MCRAWRVVSQAQVVFAITTTTVTSKLQGCAEVSNSLNNKSRCPYYLLSAEALELK